MTTACIIALIFSIAAEYGVPGHFVYSIAREENWTLNPGAVSSPNRNGTRDRGIMQLNDRYFAHVDWRCPESNIRAGVRHIRFLLGHPQVQTYWVAAICYNAGTAWLVHGRRPPAASLDYASRVMLRWSEAEIPGTFINKERYR